MNEASNTKRTTHSITDGPVGEAACVTQVSEVVDAAEELTVQLREADHGDGTVLVEGPRVALQPGTKVGHMGGYLLNHHPPELDNTDTNYYRSYKPNADFYTETDTGSLLLFEPESYLISLLQMASGVSNSPKKISEKRSAS